MRRDGQEGGRGMEGVDVGLVGLGLGMCGRQADSVGEEGGISTFFFFGKRDIKSYVSTRL